MPLGKSPALTPGRLAAEGLDSRLRGNGVYFGEGSPFQRQAERRSAPRFARRIFFITFKAGMLLKTRESRTKYMNSERLFRRKCAGFAIFDTNCAGFARFEANLGAYLDEKCQGIRCQVSGVRCQVHLLEGLRSLRKNSPPQVTTPAPSAPPLLNQRLWSAPGWARFSPGR